MSQLSIDAVPRFALPVPGLPLFDAKDALSLASACRLGLVPGHDGRRLSEDELRVWATVGVCLFPGGPRFLFPAQWDGSRRVTTLQWCALWVEFVADARATDPEADASSQVRDYPVLEFPSRAARAS